MRPYLPSDFDGVVDLAEHARSLDPGSPHLDAPRWRYVCGDPFATPETHFRVAEDEEGRLLGFSYRFDPPRPEGGSYRAVFVVVHPDDRRKGIGRALYQATTGEPVRAEVDPGWYLTATLDERSGAGLPFAKAMGFKKERTYLVLERTLPGRPLPEVDSDANIERFLGASAWSDWAEIHNASFAGETGAIRHDADDLESNRPDGFRPEHVRFARLGGKRVGYLFLRETTGGGYIESIGVLPEARSSGVGSSLLVSALEYLSDRGHRRVELTVDDGNRPALKMYARLGFEELSRRFYLRRTERASRRRRRSA